MENITLDDNLREMSNDECIYAITLFLDRTKIPYISELNRDKSNSIYANDKDIINTSFFFIGENVTLDNYLRIEKSIRIRIRNYGSHVIIHQMCRTNNDGITKDVAIYTLNDIIQFISKHMSVLVNADIFKKINENRNNKQTVKMRFLEYVNKLPAWNVTNKELYEYENADWLQDAEESEKFDDIYIHQYTLFENLGFDEVLTYDKYDSNTRKTHKAEIRFDNNIEYFFIGYYSDSNNTNIEYYIYENGNFRESTIDEDIYLIQFDDEYYFGNQDNILSIDYNDWKKNNERTLKAIFKMNEDHNSIMDFNKFKLIYKI